MDILLLGEYFLNFNILNILKLVSNYKNNWKSKIFQILKTPLKKNFPSTLESIGILKSTIPEFQEVTVHYAYVENNFFLIDFETYARL